MNEEKRCLIWLSSCAPVGSSLPYLLLKYFGSAKAVFEADETDLLAAPLEWNGRMAPFLNKDFSFADRVLEYCEKNGVGICTLADHFYPKRLFDLPLPPLLLYHLGEFCDLDAALTVAVVGSRTPSAYGERAAKRLSFDLARGGAVLVSGLARGIDSIAHRAALYAETFTVGVLGCGIDRVYPPEHRDLMEDVARHGLLLTEYAPGTPPNGRNFPIRNRIIAALSRATLVVEAASASGSLITAEHALRLGRELYTVPSSIFSAASAGSNHLLTLGAKCALRAQDVLSSLTDAFPELRPVAPKGKARRKKSEKEGAYAFPGSEADQLPSAFSEKAPKQKKPSAPRFEKTSFLSLGEAERALLSRLSHEPVAMESLANETLSASRVMMLVTSLELAGHVRRVSGNRVCLTDDAD